MEEDEVWSGKIGNCAKVKELRRDCCVVLRRVVEKMGFVVC